MEAILHAENVIDRGWVPSTIEPQLPVVGAVTAEECQVLYDLVVGNGFQNVIETGIARGISTLALAQALKVTGGSLVGFDPCQADHHGDAAVKVVNEFGLEDVFELRREPAQTGIPRLPDDYSLDFAFVDDVHNFHHRLVTFFMLDGMLKVGGMIGFHDLWLPSMKKLLRLIQTFGTYRLIETPRAQPGLNLRAKRLISAAGKFKPYCCWWPNGFSNLLILKKEKEFDKGFDWFENF